MFNSVISRFKDLVVSSLLISSSYCLLKRSTKLIFDSNSNSEISLLFSCDRILNDSKFFSSNSSCRLIVDPFLSLFL